jgi:hypothetical protein
LCLTQRGLGDQGADIQAWPPRPSTVLRVSRTTQLSQKSPNPHSCCCGQCAVRPARYLRHSGRVKCRRTPAPRRRRHRPEHDGANRHRGGRTASTAALGPLGQPAPPMAHSGYGAWRQSWAPPGRHLGGRCELAATDPVIRWRERPNVDRVSQGKSVISQKWNLAHGTKARPVSEWRHPDEGVQCRSRSTMKQHRASLYGTESTQEVSALIGVYVELLA